MGGLAVAAPLRVGIVGLSSERGWAATAHVPAIRSVEGVELAGACGSTPESSRRGAEAHGLDRAYDNPEDLAASDDIDLVVVTVKVSRHLELVSTALDAGKAVFCEWPLGNGLDEAETLARRAAERGVTNVVGLQVLSAPFLNHLADVVGRGEIGEVLSTSMIASGAAWGATLRPEDTYLMDPAEGATMLTIPMGHTLAGVEAVLGRLVSVQGTTAIRRPTATELPGGTVHRRGTPDQLAVTGVLESGAPAVLHYRGGTSKATNFHWEINGSLGDIVVTGLNGHMQMGLVQVSMAGKDQETLQPLATPAEYERVHGLPVTSPAYTVAHSYERLVREIRTGQSLLPDFADGVQHHRLLAAIDQATATGTSTPVLASRAEP
jgi:predicted dehydrogenase